MRSTTNPIIVIHTSGHASVANSAMLKLLNLSDSSKDPEGGHLGRDKNGKLNGKLEENASFKALLTITEKMKTGDSKAQAMNNLMKAQEEWLSYGQTTICDGRTMGESVDLLEQAATEGLFKADVVYFPDYEYFKKDLDVFKPKYMKYKNHLKLGGFKFSDDGSPQEGPAQGVEERNGAVLPTRQAPGRAGLHAALRARARRPRGRAGTAWDFRDGRPSAPAAPFPRRRRARGLCRPSRWFRRTWRRARRW